MTPAGPAVPTGHRLRAEDQPSGLSPHSGGRLRVSQLPGDHVCRGPRSDPRDAWALGFEVAALYPERHGFRSRQPSG